MFHGRIPYNILYHNLLLRSFPIKAATTDFADELRRRTKIFYNTKKNATQSYINLRKSYNKQSKASHLKEKDHCIILQLKANHHLGWRKLFLTFAGSDHTYWKQYHRRTITSWENLIPKNLKPYIGSSSGILTPKIPPQGKYQEAQWQFG